MSAQPLKIFVVDDEPMARMIATFAFDSPEYQVFEFESGAQCLAALDKKPDVILMDIEMPGMDGISACQSLRKSGLTDAQVIFLSGYNDLETRMRAYDAGGNDYLVKPYEPEEVLRKITSSQQIAEQARNLSEQAQYAQKTAFAAMSSMGELGIIMQFLRASFAASTQKKLADEVFRALEQLGLTGLLGLHKPEPGYCVSTQGVCSPIELSILSHARGMGHVFQFRDRLIVNSPNLTLVAFNLPLDDPDRVGRLRDNLAVLAEGADARLAAIVSDRIRESQSAGIGNVLNELTRALESIESTQAARRMSVLGVMNDYVRELEASFVNMGLSQDQEKNLSELANVVADRVGRLAGEDKDLGDHLRTVSDRLKALGGGDRD